jgi:hypothetical protein
MNMCEADQHWDQLYRCKMMLSLILYPIDVISCSKMFMAQIRPEKCLFILLSKFLNTSRHA